jgi:phosphoribosylformylglycinamidine (FGAM) synthase PurS component
VLHGEATDKQRSAIRRAIKQHGLDEQDTRRVFKAASLELDADEQVNHAIDLLSKQQASNLLDVLKQVPLPTGASDVPADASGFESPPVDEGQVPFFSESDAA